MEFTHACLEWREVFRRRLVLRIRERHRRRPLLDFRRLMHALLERHCAAVGYIGVICKARRLAEIDAFIGIHDAVPNNIQYAKNRVVQRFVFILIAGMKQVYV